MSTSRKMYVPRNEMKISSKPLFGSRIVLEIIHNPSNQIFEAIYDANSQEGTVIASNWYHHATIHDDIIVVYTGYEYCVLVLSKKSKPIMEKLMSDDWHLNIIDNKLILNYQESLYGNIPLPEDFAKLIKSYVQSLQSERGSDIISLVCNSGRVLDLKYIEDSHRHPHHINNVKDSTKDSITDSIKDPNRYSHQ